MKKFSLFICLIIVLNIFSACGMKEEADTQSSSREKETSEIVSVVSSKENEASASEYTSTEESKSENSAKEESTVANPSKEDETSSKKESDSSSASSAKSQYNPNSSRSGEREIKVHPHLDRKPVVPYYGTDKLDKFLRYLETPWSEEAFDADNEYNKPTAEWVIRQNRVLIPKIEEENEDINISRIFGIPVFTANPEQASNKAGYTFRFYLDKKYSTTEMLVVFLPLVGNEQNEELLTLVNTYRDEKFKFKKGVKECKWGEYYIDNENKNMYFRFDNYLINVFTYSYGKKLSLELLELFDLEYHKLMLRNF